MTPIALRPRLLRNAHLRLLVEVVERAQDAYDDPNVLMAARSFFGRRFADRDALDLWLEERDAHSQFLPWLLWDAELPGGAKAIIGALNPQSPSELEVLRGLMATRARVWQVVQVRGGLTTLRQIGSDATVDVDEPVLCRVAVPGELYVARVLQLPGVALLDAVHACAPASGEKALLRASNRAARAPLHRQLPILLAACDLVLRRLPTPGQDGTALLRHATLVYEIEDIQSVDAAMQCAVQAGHLEVQACGRYSIRDANFGPVGAVLRRTQGRLYAATGLPREHELRQALSAALPGLKPRTTLYRDVRALFEPHLRATWHPEALRSFARDFLGECLMTFPDTPYTWLGGATPREAILTPDGRAEVQAWLRRVEQVSAVAGPGYERAAQTIWRDLTAAG